MKCAVYLNNNNNNNILILWKVKEFLTRKEKSFLYYKVVEKSNLITGEYKMS